MTENEMKSWFRLIISWICVVYFSAVLLWSAIFAATGEQLIFIRWVSYVAPWLAGLLLIAALSTLLCRNKLAALLMLLAALPVGYPHIQLPVLAASDPATGQVYKFMTYSKMGRNRNIAAVAEVVMSEKPDVLFMQEINGEDVALLNHALRDIYNGAQVFSFADGQNNLILSRFEVIPRQQKGDYSLAAEITMPESSVSVWNIHLHKAIFNTDWQYKMVEQLADQIAAAESPVIAAGDFNASVVNYPYIKIRQHLNNAFEEAGSGLGFTFPSPARRMGMIAPFLRIDHIFSSDHFNIHNAYVVGSSGGSDHYPVVANLSFKRKGN